MSEKWDTNIKLSSSFEYYWLEIDHKGTVPTPEKEECSDLSENGDGQVKTFLGHCEQIFHREVIMAGKMTPLQLLQTVLASETIQIIICGNTLANLPPSILKLGCSNITTLIF